MIQGAFGTAPPAFLNDQNMGTVGSLLNDGGKELILFKWTLFGTFSFSPFLQSPEVVRLKVNTHHRYDAVNHVIRADINGIQAEEVSITALYFGEPVIDLWIGQNDVQRKCLVVFIFIGADRQPAGWYCYLDASFGIAENGALILKYGQGCPRNGRNFGR